MLSYRPFRSCRLGGKRLTGTYVLKTFLLALDFRAWDDLWINNKAHIPSAPWMPPKQGENSDSEKQDPQYVQQTKAPRQGLQHAVCWPPAFRRGCLLTLTTVEEPPDYSIKSYQEENVDHRRGALTYSDLTLPTQLCMPGQEPRAERISHSGKQATKEEGGKTKNVMEPPKPKGKLLLGLSRY